MNKPKPERIPVDIPGFDSLIQGGFKRKSINLVAGPAGSGKTIFAIQFLVDGIIRFKEPGIYVTFEEKKDKLYEDMLGFGWDLAKFEKAGMFIFLEYTPEQVKKVLVEGGGTVDAIIEKMNAKRLVIDSITSFVLLYQDELTRKEAALALFELISKWNCTAILTAQEKFMNRDTLEAELEFELDSIILLYHVKLKGGRRRAIEVLKMRGTKIPDQTYALDITTKGIVVNPKEQLSF